MDNDPLKMKRLSAVFNIDVESLNQLWLFIPKSKSDARDLEFLSRFSEFMSVYSSPVLAGRHEGNLLIFSVAPASMSEREELVQEFMSYPDIINNDYRIVYCDCLQSTSDVHRVYFDALRHAEQAQRIYPKSRICRHSHISVAKACDKVAESADSLDYYLALLNKLRNKPELLSTLTTYLLDEGSNLERTARALSCHVNTVKYRLRSVRDAFGLSVSAMPDMLPLYIAAAINRIMESHSASSSKEM